MFVCPNLQPRALSKKVDPRRENGQIHLVQVSWRSLSSDFQRLDQLTVAIDVFPLQIIKQAPSLPDQFQQPASGAEILAVLFQVFGDIFDPTCEQSNLDFWRAGV